MFVLRAEEGVWVQESWKRSIYLLYSILNSGTSVLLFISAAKKKPSLYSYMYLEISVESQTNPNKNSEICSLFRYDIEEASQRVVSLDCLSSCTGNWHLFSSWW